MTADLRFRLLGNLEVLRRGEVVPITSNKLRIMLATLALSAGRTVPVDSIIERLWGSDASVSARSTVQVYAMRLRRVLGEDVLQTRSNGYAINVAAEHVDVAVFQDLVTKAKTAPDPVAAYRLLTEALGLWRGPALFDLASDSLQSTVVPRLTEERLLAVERHAELGIELGKHDGLVAELADLARQHPLRERFWALLMVALNRSGRKIEALAAYQEVRQLYADEFGIDPSDALQRLHQSVLTDSAPAAPAPVRSVVRPAQLPPDVTGFVGRTRMIEELSDRLAAGGMPVVLLTGPPGIGKTALALRVAHRVRLDYPDGQLYVNLQGYAPTPPLPVTVVLARFLYALGVPDNQVPADLDEQTNLYRSLLADRKVLVVLDNASGPGQVRPLLPGQPGCAVVITSRDALRGLVALDGGWQVPLGPLRAGESRAVLAAILGEARVAAQPDAVAALADQCAQLPLALRIAAANLQANPHQPIASYVDELAARGRLNQLRVRGDDAAAVQAAFDLSYERLDPDAACLFHRMSLAPGTDLSVAAAAALLDSSDEQAALLLDALAAANLIFPSGSGRYQMHDLLREYAGIRAGQDTDADAAARRVLDFYLYTADAASRLVYPDQVRAPWPAREPTARTSKFDTEAAALAWLDSERATFGAAAVLAANYGVTHYGWQLADATYAYFGAHGHSVDALAVCDAALADARRAGDTCVESYVLDFLGVIHFRISRYAIAEHYHSEALALGRRNGDLRCQAVCLRHLGRVTAQLGLPERTIGYHQEALDLAVQLGDLDEQAINSTYLGFAHQSAGRLEQAFEWHERALDLCHRTGNESIRSSVHGGLGLVAWHRGELDLAIDHQRAAIASALAVGDLHLHAGALICLAEALCAAGQYDQAIAEATTAVNLRTGERRQVISAAEIITTARLGRGERASVIEDYQRALRQAQEINFRYGEVSILIALATAYRLTDQLTMAAQHAERAIAIMRDTGMRALESRAEAELALCRSLTAPSGSD